MRPRGYLQAKPIVIGLDVHTWTLIQGYGKPPTLKQPTFQIGAPAEYSLGSLGIEASDRLN
jgi:hypothetical protein